MKNMFFYTLFLVSINALYSQENPPAPTDDKNWVSSISYDLYGNTTSKGVSYFNTLGKATQSQSWDILTGKIWNTEARYDYQGRPAFQTLSAPIGNNFGYQSRFIKKSNGSTYATADFETNPTNPSTVGSYTNSLGWYYSNNNSSEIYQDITSYPFSRTIYSRLNPGKVLKTLGGNKVKKEGTNQWLNGYSFTMPAAQEMYYAFGKDYFPVGKTILNQTSATRYVPSGYYECSIKSCDTGQTLNNIIIYLYSSFNLVEGKVYQFKVNGTKSYYTLLFADRLIDFEGGGEPTFEKSIIPKDGGDGSYTTNAIIAAPAYDTCPIGPIYNLKVTKSISRDVNGIETVVFTDIDGNTLAAARSGNEDNANQKKYNVVSPISKQGFVDIHIPVGCGGIVTFKGPYAAKFNIYNLITEARIQTNKSGSTVLKPGFYRVEETTTYHENELPYVTINGSSIELLDDASQVAVSYNVNYYDYSLNYYDKAGRLTKSVQPQGFDDALTLSTSARNHQLTSTFSYNTLGQLLNTTTMKALPILNTAKMGKLGFRKTANKRY